MSGFVALVNVDGQPVDQALLDNMTRRLGVRGPHGRNAATSGNAGFGHAFLHLDHEGPQCAQPHSFGDCRWLVADARLDAREELIAGLKDAVREDFDDDAPDAELIAHAYDAWGEACVERLIGDFAFAIWNAPRRRLLVARDQLGVKPLFYAHLGQMVVVSNALDCIRQHPAVSRSLNDTAIADFLLFGANQNAATTVFRDVQRLPPAHIKVWTQGASCTRRYWTLPVDDPVHFRHQEEYSQRFRDLLGDAVRDRMRARRVAILMSGGVDSSSLAVAAAETIRGRSSETSLLAITSVYDRLIPDAERHFAGLVARHLRIPIKYDVRDNETSIADWDRVAIQTPEPVANPAASEAGVKFFGHAAEDARVFLYGEGPDDALKYEWRPYLTHLWRARRGGEMLHAVASDLLMHRRLPFWSSMRQRLRPERDTQWTETFPDWLDADFARDTQCHERWSAHHRPREPQHVVRPRAYLGLTSIHWPVLFGDCDLMCGETGTEMRYPFLDLRVLRYMLAVPAMPWCRNKMIIRHTMRSSLPRAVLRRQKTSLAANPDFERVKAFGFPRVVPAPDLSKYVDPLKIPAAPRTTLELRVALRPLGLNYWLQNR